LKDDLCPGSGSRSP